MSEETTFVIRRDVINQTLSAVFNLLEVKKLSHAETMFFLWALKDELNTSVEKEVFRKSKDG